MTRMLIAASAALFAFCAPAQAETKITQISASIILLGDPAVEPVPAEEAGFREAEPDVMAGGERREAGAIAAVEEMPVAEDEKTSAIGAADDADTPPYAPLKDAELRRGS